MIQKYQTQLLHNRTFPRNTKNSIIIQVCHLNRQRFYGMLTMCAVVGCHNCHCKNSNISFIILNGCREVPQVDQFCFQTKHRWNTMGDKQKEIAYALNIFCLETNLIYLIVQIMSPQFILKQCQRSQVVLLMLVHVAQLVMSKHSDVQLCKNDQQKKRKKKGTSISTKSIFRTIMEPTARLGCC